MFSTFLYLSAAAWNLTFSSTSFIYRTKSLFRFWFRQLRYRGSYSICNFTPPVFPLVAHLPFQVCQNRWLSHEQQEGKRMRAHHRSRGKQCRYQVTRLTLSRFYMLFFFLVGIVALMVCTCQFQQIVINHKVHKSGKLYLNLHFDLPTYKESP